MSFTPMETTFLALAAVCAVWLGGISFRLSRMENRLAALGRLDAKLDLLLKHANIRFDPYAAVQSEIAQAIRRKLVLEIAGLQPKIIFAAAQTSEAPRIDCQIGEKLRWRWMPLYDR